MTQRALLYRSGALGDTLLCLPVLDALRYAYPGAQITFAAHPAYAAPLLGAGRADSLLDAGAPPFHLLYTAPVMTTPVMCTEPVISPAPEGKDELDGLLTSFGPIVLFTHDPEGAAARRLAAIDSAETLIASPFPPEGSRRHTAEWMLSAHVAHVAHRANISISDIEPLVQSTKIQHDNDPHLKQTGASSSPLPGTRITSPEPLTQSSKIQRDTDTYLKRINAHQTPFLAIHPGGGGQPKWPPPATLTAIARRYCESPGATPLLIEGPADEAPARGFVREFEKTRGGEIFRLESPPLDILSAILARASGFIGGDSGVTHLAALSGAPSLALFGPASNPARWAPIGPRAAWIAWDNADEGIKKLDELTDISE